MAAFTVYMVRLGIENGFPMFTHADRFAFMLKLDLPFYTFIMHNRSILIPFIGVLITVPRFRWQGVAMIAWLLVFSVLFAEKFGSLFTIITLAAIPFGLLHIARGREIKLQIVGGIAAAIAVVTVPVTLLVYGAAKDPGAALEAYGGRAALQGQLWWQGDAHYLQLFAFDDTAVSADIKSWADPTADDRHNVTTAYGLYYVMQRFAPSSYLGWTMEGGTGFVFSLYPYLLMTTGLLGLILISSALAVYNCMILAFFAQALARGNWIASVMLGRVMASMLSCYTTGYLYQAFGIKTVLLLVAAILVLKTLTGSRLGALFAPKVKRRA